MKENSAKEKSVKLVGLMSGTSVDGIDAALVEVSGGQNGDPLRWNLDAFRTEPWNSELRGEILDACSPQAPLRRVSALHFRLGEVFGDAANRLIEGAGLTASDIAAVCSHGQTIWHEPNPFSLQDGSQVRSTFQIGEGAVIAEKTGCRVVCNFRSADAAAGGQGAPLVPFVDALLFRHPTETRTVQNIGGIANLTYLPPLSALEGTHPVFAFDTGPGNMILDALVFRASGGTQTFDREAALAAQGRVSRALLNELKEKTPFFQKPPPKSTGREEFGEAFVLAFERRAEALHLSLEDRLATAAALTAETIEEAYRCFLPSLPDTVILGGGGVRNPLLREMLKAKLPECSLRTHADFGLDDDAKEAVAFALLGYHTLLGLPSNLPAATGAGHSAMLGQLCFPPPASR